MKEVVEVIAKSLVTNPDAVEVMEEEKYGETVISLRVDPADMGKVIGRGGRIAKAIRNVIKIQAIAENRRVVLDILD